jgi:hypothetical protein
MERTTRDWDTDYSSIRKPRRASVRQGSRDAAFALADFMTSLAESTAEFWAATAEGVAAGFQSARDTLAEAGEPRETRRSNPREYADVFAAAARYFDEMSRLAQRMGEDMERPRAESIDYDRLAKAVAAELQKMRTAETSGVQP